MSTPALPARPPRRQGLRGNGAAATRRLDVGVLAGYGAVIAAAFAVGGAAGVQPMLAIGAVIGITVAAIAFVNLTAGVLMFVALMFFETMPGVSGGPSVTKLVGILLVGGWLASMAISHPEDRVSRDILSRHPLLLLLMALFLSWAFTSLLWAESTPAGQEAALRFTLNFVLFPIVFAALRTTKHVQWVYALFIGGALLSAGVGLASGQFYEGNRLEGVGINANQLGMLLMVSTVLGASLACNPRWPTATRLGMFGVAGLCAVALIATASRGALFGLAVGLLLAPLVAGRGRRLSAMALIGLAAVTAIVFITMLTPTSGVTRLTQDYSGGTGRVDIWTVGLRMVNDRPFTGVGIGSFKSSSIHYLLEPGTLIRDDFIVDEPKVPHNIYLHVLAELGAVGLTLFLVILASCLAATLRAARAFARKGDVTGDLLARGLFVALAGLLAAEFFSSQLYSKQLWLLLATTPALLAIAERREDRAKP